MTSLQIIGNLKIFQDLLLDLYYHEIDFVRTKKDYLRLEKSVTSQYSFVSLELTGITKENDYERENMHCHLEFEIKNSTIVLSDLHLADAIRISEVKKLIEQYQSRKEFIWDKDSDTILPYDDTTLHYLAIADRIAAHCLNCTSGDDYRPGYYSKIALYDDCIILSQVNHMNAKSLDHKNDYSLRNLEFTVPLTPLEHKVGFNDELIGDLLIHFSDRSSSNNKLCGDRIREQIEIEKSVFSKL